MKKYLSILILLVITIFSVNVYAEEIPQSGVRYVITSANGEVSKTFDYSAAKISSEKEELVYSGKTDSNGEVSLEGWNKDAEIRVNKEGKKGRKRLKKARKGESL